MPTFSVLEGRDPLLSIEFEPGDAVVAESNSMVMTDGAVSVEGRMQGGFFSSLARNLFSDESFFQQVLKADKGKPGQALLAPQLPGDIEIIEVGEQQYFLNSGCYMASEATVSTSQRLNSSVLGAFFGSTGGIVVMRTEGRGKLCLSGFGQIVKVSVEPGQEIVVDNGHIVAWDTRLDYRVTTASSKKGIFGRMVSTAMSGEYLVTRFAGKGDVYIASRNLLSYETYIRSLIPNQNS